jgi:drug/metabolite transporter (DMT)-like permease
MIGAMDFITPLLSAVAESVAKVTDKFNYQKYKILPKQLLFVLFSTMVAGLVVFGVITHQTAPNITLATVGLIALMILISFGQNFFDYEGMYTKNLSLREPINNFQPVLAAFLAYVLFPSERNSKYITAILVGSIVLYIGNANRKLRLELDKGIIYLFLGAVASAILASVYKVGLEHVSPFYMLFFRSVGVLLLIAIFFRPRMRGIKNGQAVLGIGSGILYIVGNLLQLYSIKHLGLNFTIMILTLGPALIYMGSAFVLKEKVLPKQVIASLALVAIIVWAIYL